MTLQTSKYWLQAENDRNTHHGQVFIDLIKRAFGEREVVMVGHHFVFEPQEAMAALDLTQLNEIPSADTMIFDHDIMGAVFGAERAQTIMLECARTRCDERDAVVARELKALDVARAVTPDSPPDQGFPLDGDE